MVPAPVIVMPTAVRGSKHPHGGGGAAIGGRLRRSTDYLTTSTTNFSVLLRDAYIGDNGAFVAALFLSAVFTALVTLLGQASRRAEHAVLARRPRPALKVRAAAAFVHGVRMFMLYLAVMVAMTRNLWLLFAMVLGHMLGWLVFSTFAAARADPDERDAVVEGVFDDDSFDDDGKLRQGDKA